MRFMYDGIVISSIELPENASSPISESFELLAKLTLFNFLQYSNALSMQVTLYGIVMLTIAVDAKAYLMLVTVCGIVMLSIVV